MAFSTLQPNTRNIQYYLTTHYIFLSYLSISVSNNKTLFEVNAEINIFFLPLPWKLHCLHRETIIITKYITLMPRGVQCFYVPLLLWGPVFLCFPTFMGTSVPMFPYFYGDQCSYVSLLLWGPVFLCFPTFRGGSVPMFPYF